MTAEIAILNKQAVALAADSAVTIGRGASAKIYNSVNKIFELHATAPVGVMIYGSTLFMGLPLETLIKKYRSDEKSTFPKISDYKASFLSWLSSKVIISKEDGAFAAMLVAADILESIGSQINSELLASIRANGKYLKSKDNQIAMAIINREINEIKQHAQMPYASRAYCRQIDTDFGAVFDAVISHKIKQIVPNKATKEALHKLVLEHVVRAKLSSHRTGIVIAGFGDDEICPSLEHIEVEGVLGGHIKHIDVRSVDVGRRGPHAEALGFAQSDMIERFLHGIDPEMSDYAEKMISDSIESTAKEIYAAVAGGRTLPADVKKIIEKIQKDQRANIAEYKKTEYTDSIIDMIRHMPKQEISNLAKALIDITSLKRKVSREQESVGGEVDVAVISKSEGFVWVSRKHYFPREINSRFFARHYNNTGRVP